MRLRWKRPSEDVGHLGRSVPVDSTEIPLPRSLGCLQCPEVTECDIGDVYNGRSDWGRRELLGVEEVTDSRARQRQVGQLLNWLNSRAIASACQAGGSIASDTSGLDLRDEVERCFVFFHVLRSSAIAQAGSSVGLTLKAACSASFLATTGSR
jgi:hypothetical protein